MNLIVLKDYLKAMRKEHNRTEMLLMYGRTNSSYGENGEMEKKKTLKIKHYFCKN